MSTERPTSVGDMIAWLRAHPEEPFLTLRERDRLIVGTRNDEGELCAWDCTVNAHRIESDRPPRREEVK